MRPQNSPEMECAVPRRVAVSCSGDPLYMCTSELLRCCPQCTECQGGRLLCVGWLDVRLCTTVNVHSPHRVMKLPPGLRLRSCAPVDCSHWHRMAFMPGSFPLNRVQQDALPRSSAASGCGSRTSAFFSQRMPLLQAQRGEERQQQQQQQRLCVATTLQPQGQGPQPAQQVPPRQSAAQPQQAVAVGPAAGAQTAPPRSRTAQVPDEKRDIRLRDRTKRCTAPVSGAASMQMTVARQAENLLVFAGQTRCTSKCFTRLGSTPSVASLLHVHLQGSAWRAGGGGVRHAEMRGAPRVTTPWRRAAEQQALGGRRA